MHGDLGDAVRVSPKATENDTIAFFPQEWLRDPASPFLRSGHHDVPWEESEFIRECVRGPNKQEACSGQQNRVPALSTARVPRS